MSSAAISAESQRSFLAMREIGGQCNSGEGEKIHFTFQEGIGATIKQIASGRFGVNAGTLSQVKKFKIKVCQGAKPGEADVNGNKVDTDIAKARYAIGLT